MKPETAASIRCECGSEDVMIAFRTPLYVYVVDGYVTRTVVLTGQDVMLGGVARCLVCDRFWLLDERPDLTPWPRPEFA